MLRSSRKRNLVCFLLALLPFGAAHGRSTEEEIGAVEKGLRPYHTIAGEAPYDLAGRMEHYGVPGVSIAVFEEFRIRWIATYGEADARSGMPVTDSTIFCVGSVSKAVTAAGVLSLVADGSVDLDEDVNLQLRSWSVPENEFTRQAPVTPRGLLNHTGGAVFSPPHTYVADAFPSVLQSLRGEAPATSRALAIDGVPGSRFQYSNAGFTVMRLLIEEKSGRRFDGFIADRVFEPLGMNHSTFAIPLAPRDRARAATGHGPDGKPFPGPERWIGHIAAGGLYTTAADYAAFLIDLQNSYRGEEGKVLPPALAREMLSPQAAPEYGLGVFLRELDGETYFSHIGDARGFVAGFTAHRTRGYGAVVLTNGHGGLNLVREIFRSVGDVYDWPGYRTVPREAIGWSDGERDRLEGRYRIGCDQVVALVPDGDGLRIEAEGLPGFRLYRVAPDTLVCRERDGWIALGGGAPLSLLLGLSDEIGRLPAEPRKTVRMEEGERTPWETLLDGDLDAAHAAYAVLRGEDPANPEIAEGRFNRLGYRHLQAGRLEEALAIFRLNVRLYPMSANAHDSLGEGLAAVGKKEEAAASYRRSLELNPENTNAEEMLRRLAEG